MSQQLWPSESEPAVEPLPLGVASPPQVAGAEQLTFVPPPLALVPPPLAATPVPIATPAPVVDQSRSVRLPARWLPLTTIALGVALVASAVWGYQTSKDLSQTRDQLATANGTIASVQAQLSAEQVRSAGFQASISGLQAQVQTEGICVAELGAAKKQLDAISSAETDAFNLLAVGSTYAIARAARDTANSAAIDDYYNAFSAAWDGSRTTANSWISRGNTQLGKANTDLSSMNAEIAKVNTLNDQITQMETDYGATDLSACSSSASPSGVSS